MEPETAPKSTIFLPRNAAGSTLAFLGAHLLILEIFVTLNTFMSIHMALTFYS
jgi:hypothetical protein